ncbi:MAG: (d)CMP kinase [Proteobacteria bacterium]|nr:(d)CMP kinase [Pseudomonadota bacterium]
MKKNPPVITVDGPSGSGKGTLSRQLAQTLGWHFLDSGALYRLLALAAMRHAVALDNHTALAVLAGHLDVVFAKNESQIFLEGQEVTLDIRTETCGGNASVVAAIPAVREALLDRQRAFLEPPGLVADGRDMGTVVFPQANLKIFLEASAQERAKRRQGQLKEQGIDVSLDDLLAEISARDTRDRQRSVAPLVPASDAIVLDTTTMPIKVVFETVMAEVRGREIF